MAFVRIIATPPGEAPEKVRRAWVGLVLPLHERQPDGPRAVRTAGVLSGPRSLGGLLWALLTGRTEKMEGFLTPAGACVDVLEAHDAEAAAWWRAHAPHLLEAGRAFVFPAECCEFVPQGTPP